MGTVSSSCESCFGNKPGSNKSRLNPNTIQKKDKYQELKTDYYAQNSERSMREMPKSLNSSPALRATRYREKRVGNKTIEEVREGGDHKKLTKDDFNIVKVLGRGAYGKVYLVQRKGSKKFLALKTLKKKVLIEGENVDHAITEKNVMQKSMHPFIVRLQYSFQTESTLYLVMEFCPGGELFRHLKNKGKFDEETVRFYAAEVILGMQYLHEELKIIYRDLKPENILIDASGHIKLTDFGLSKNAAKTYTICGTTSYMAPEILTKQGYDKTVDWWSLGCLIYEMLGGYPPFSKEKEILESEPTMLSHFSFDAKDLISKLMVKDPTKRLGYNGVQEIKRHYFFRSIDWDDVLALKKKPPFIPMLTRADDLRNFDKGFLGEPVVETPPGGSFAEPSNDPKELFPNFSYVNKDLGTDKAMQETKLFG